AAFASDAVDRDRRDRGSFSLDGTRLRFFHPSIRRRESFLMLADTHLFRDDARGEPFRTYSGRMARAYNHTRHFLTGEETDPESCFRASLEHAVQKGFSRLALVGDILSFPSEAGVEWTMQQLASVGIPYVYTAGNHDWHYEGMEGSSNELRRQWSAERLQPLYGSTDPLFHLEPMGDTDLLLIDNSTYEILPEQLDFFRERKRKGRPMLLLLHIPLYVPGRPLGFGCGHPDWKAANDRSWQLERRQPWRTEGHTRTTMAFHRAVFRSDDGLPPGRLPFGAGHGHPRRSYP
ncbi:MAG: metallophosphoesterase, partial [Chitinophagia bacterium]|nr:metallophosphoesterase [Chitinophagia bacterium]